MSMFFGEYLEKKSVITHEDRWKAVQLQHRTNLLFGETARSLGMITHEDVERVHTAQRKTDLDFGGMCMKMGLLSKEQVRQVAEHQKKNRLRLGDALVRIKAIPDDALPGLLEAYEAHLAVCAAEEEPSTPSLPHQDLWQMYADRTYRIFNRFVNLAFKPDQKTIVTGIDPNDMVVAMRMKGDAPCLYLLSISTDIRDAIARGMLRQDDLTSRPGAEIIDAVKEFVNIVCGSIASQVATMGGKIAFGNAEILEVQERFSPWANSKGLLFPLNATEGRVEVAIFGEG